MARHISAYSPMADRMIAEDRARLRRVEKINARKKFKQRLIYSIGPTLLLAMGATVIASAQSSSPFANQKKVNAWELPQADQAQTPNSAPDARTPSQSAAPRLQLRTRSLDPASATEPPPGAVANTPARPTPSRQAARSAPAAPPAMAKPAPAPARASVSASETTRSTRTQTYSSSSASSSANSTTSASASATGSANPYSSPLTAPPLNQPTYSASAGATQSVPSANYTYQPPAPASNYSASSGLAGNYGSVPRSSVNNPPSSVDNPADYTLHQVPPYYAPGQVPRGPQYDPQYEQWVQSNNPTAYDYGYARPGETPPQGQPQGGSGPYGEAPASGPFSKPYPGEAPYPEGPYGYDQPNPYGSSPYDPQPRRSFLSRIGLGGVAALVRGAVRAGIGARESNGDWEEVFIGDADIDIELSTVTRSGLEWGVHGQARVQYDEGRKGFVRRLPDCPPTLAGCASITVPGSILPASVRGHTSQFYTSGPDVAENEQFALESAHIFLRSAYGDLTVGRDDGAAYLFSLGAPSLLNIGASNSPVDYTGLDSVKTVNDASGFSEKITYTSPRLLGDQVGIGIQFGLSYAMDASACGVDYCVDLNDIPDVVAPDIQDIFEAGLALDRTFAPGVSVEATATYAMGQEQSGLMGLDDLQAYNAGLEFKFHDFTLGGSWLKSNQGLSNGDYDAYDVGVTWQPSRLGFTLGYGHAEDELVGLESDQVAGGISWDVNERARISLGAQYADRESLRDVGGVAQTGSENATSVFIEGGFRF